MGQAALPAGKRGRPILSVGNEGALVIALWAGYWGRYMAHKTVLSLKETVTSHCESISAYILISMRHESADKQGLVHDSLDDLLVLVAVVCHHKFEPLWF